MNKQVRNWGIALLLWCLSWHGHSAPLHNHKPELTPCQHAAQETVLRLQTSDSSGNIAIIIDDLGYNRRLGMIATMLPGAITLAVLPHSPHGTWLAELAAQSGKEVMVHLPMSSQAGSSLDKGALTEAMARDEFLSVLRSNLQAVPLARGANNHMGSLLTQQQEPMEWLMEELALQQMFFVDSRTTPLTVAGRVAKEQGLPVAEREIFLDNDRDCRAIAGQFLRLARIAQRQGQSLAIGHPYSETLAFLGAVLPQLETSGLKLVSVSELLSSDTTSSTKRELLNTVHMNQGAKGDIRRAGIPDAHKFAHKPDGHRSVEELHKTYRKKSDDFES